MMKKWKEKAASKAGFTLVELIVVIAVLAILAAVAVPTYSGYVSKAKQANDITTLGSVATAVMGSAAGDQLSVNKIIVTRGSDGSVSTVKAYNNDTEVTIDSSEIMMLLDISAWSALDFDADWTTATMTGGQWTLS